MVNFFYEEVEMSTTTPVAEKWTKAFPIALLVLALGLVLSYSLISPHPITIPSASVSSSVSSLGAGWEADAARYTAMAKIYAAQTANIQRGRDADAARYTAMTNRYIVSTAGIQRGYEADAARYTAMAELYTAKEAANIQRGRDADAARYNAMAEYYMNK